MSWTSQLPISQRLTQSHQTLRKTLIYVLKDISKCRPFLESKVVLELFTGTGFYKYTCYDCFSFLFFLFSVYTIRRFGFMTLDV